jgi:hypothetical protein
MRTTSNESADSQVLTPFWASLFLPPPPLLAVLTTLAQSVYPLVTDPPNPPAGCRVDNCPAATLPRRTWTESIAIRMRRRGSALWSRRPVRPPASRAARRRHVGDRGHQLWVVGWVSPRPPFCTARAVALVAYLRNNRGTRARTFQRQ